MSNMRRILHDHPNMSVNSRTAVPPAVRLGRIIDAYGKYICSCKAQLRSKIELETRVSVRLRAYLAPVQVNTGVSVDAVKLDAHTPAFPIRGRCERLAIPTRAIREKAAT